MNNINNRNFFNRYNYTNNGCVFQDNNFCSTFHTFLFFIIYLNLFYRDLKVSRTVSNGVMKIN